MSSSSREYSPDWLRNHQPAATSSIWTLSSSDEKDDDQLPISSVMLTAAKGKLTKPLQAQEEPKTSVRNLPSDSESQGQRPDDDDADAFEQTSASKLEPSKKRLQSAETKDNAADLLKVLQSETTDEKQTGPYISSSRLPLVLPDKVQRSKVLVECEGESIDLSGDLGSVGRVVISDSPSGNQDMLLDLKGTIYKTTIMPSRTLCIVSFCQSEARIEAIMNDFIQLKPQSNVYEAETMVEGTLEGFSFDSEDEGDKYASRPTDENEGVEPQTNGKSRGKSEAAKKKGKTAVKRLAAKKVNKKKAPVTKKTKAKK